MSPLTFPLNNIQMERSTFPLSFILLTKSQVHWFTVASVDAG